MEYESMRMPELIYLTRYHELRNYSQMRKAELVAFLAIWVGIILRCAEACRAERALNLTFSKCLNLVDLNNPRILMMHDKMAVTTNIRA